MQIIHAHCDFLCDTEEVYWPLSRSNQICQSTILHDGVCTIELIQQVVSKTTAVVGRVHYFDSNLCSSPVGTVRLAGSPLSNWFT